MDGFVPPAVVQAPRFKLLLSPVEPAFATHAGAAVDPSVNATFTVTEEPLLKFAREPPALPTMLNSDCLQTAEISSTLSLALRVKTCDPLLKTTVSFPPATAEPDSVSLAREVIAISGAATMALFLKQSPPPSLPKPLGQREEPQ